MGNTTTTNTTAPVAMPPAVAVAQLAVQLGSCTRAQAVLAHLALGQPASIAQLRVAVSKATGKPCAAAHGIVTGLMAQGLVSQAGSPKAPWYYLTALGLPAGFNPASPTLMGKAALAANLPSAAITSATPAVPAATLAAGLMAPPAPTAPTAPPAPPATPAASQTAATLPPPPAWPAKPAKPGKAGA